MCIYLYIYIHISINTYKIYIYIQALPPAFFPQEPEGPFRELEALKVLEHPKNSRVSPPWPGFKKRDQGKAVHILSPQSHGRFGWMEEDESWLFVEPKPIWKIWCKRQIEWIISTGFGVKNCSNSFRFLSPFVLRGCFLAGIACKKLQELWLQNSQSLDQKKHSTLPTCTCCWPVRKHVKQGPLVLLQNAWLMHYA